MAKPRGTTNFTPAEAQRLPDLAADGLTRVEAARLLGRSYSVGSSKISANEIGYQELICVQKPSATIC